jgi:small-conductance mechanosensitive channel
MDTGLRETAYLGITLGEWLTALATALLIFLVVLFLKAYLLRRLAAVAETTSTELDDLLLEVGKVTRPVLVACLSLCIGSLALPLDPRIAGVLATVFVIVFLLQAGLWISAFVAFAFVRTLRRRAGDDAAAQTMLAAVGFVARLAVWATVLLVALQTLGVQVTAVVAGLGIGGIALALAAQNVLGDVFGWICILLDKPFLLGDFLDVDSYKGTVERIGIKTTRLRSVTGEELIFSNSDLLGSRIRNYQRMDERRGELVVGVTYQTPPEKLREIPGMMREAAERQERARFDRAHFKSFGASSLDFELIYWVKGPQYPLFMDVQQAILHELFERFAEEGIEFAYPTQTIFHVPAEGGDTSGTEEP